MFLQLDVFENQLTAWAWREGERPGSPLLTANDSALTSGDFGLFFNSFPDSPTDAPRNGSAQFRFVQVSDQHIPFLANCDFDADTSCDAADLDLMQALGPISSGISATGNEAFDLNGDGTIDLTDRNEWLSSAATENGFGSPYKAGDANLDGIVDISDFNIWNSHKFSANLLWSAGDFNADGVVDIQDFNAWNANKFTASDTVSIPEPSSGVLWTVALLGLAALRQYHRRFSSRVYEA